MSSDQTVMVVQESVPRRVLYFHGRSKTHAERLLQILDRLDTGRFDPWVVTQKDDTHILDALAERDVPVTLTTARYRGCARPPGVLTLPGEVNLGKRIIGKVVPHIVHINSTKLELMYAGIAARLNGVPVVWHVPEVRQKNERTAIAAKLIRGCATRIVPVSRSAAQWLGPSLNGEMVLIPNGVDTELFTPDRQPSRDVMKRVGLAKSMPAVGHVGLLVPMKRVKDFVRAAAVVLRSVDVQFVISTDEQVRRTTTVRDLRRLAKELGIGRRLKFAGPDIEPADLLPCLDIAVANTVSKSSAHVLWQIAACGIPLIATRVDEVQQEDLIEKGCMLTEPGDIDGMAGSILTLLDEPDRAADLARAGRTYVVEQFSAASMVSQIQTVYEDVLKTYPGGSTISAQNYSEHNITTETVRHAPFGHSAAG